MNQKAITAVSVEHADMARSLTASDIRQRVNLIQEVMNAVMKKDVHYGIIPGCKKPTLYKAGSEVLLATFQIGTEIHETDLSTDDCIRYRVKVIGKHTPTTMVLGEGIGECSSNEEKYKWRKAYDKEWDATPENRRRIKYGKYVDKQVRTEPADVANTILKMAKKRAQIDMTLTATGASDCFEQDVEDLPEEYLDQREQPQQNQPAAKAPYSATQFTNSLPAWTTLLRSGKQVAASIIAKVETKFVMTEDQKKQLRAIKRNEPEQASEPEDQGDRHMGDAE